MGRFEDYPGLVGTGVQLLENRLGATPQGFESLPLRQIAAKNRTIAARDNLAAVLYGGMLYAYFELGISRRI